MVCVIFPPLCLDVRTYKKYVRDISNESISTVEESMHHAREEVRKLSGTSSYGIADILVSCDGTWQKRFSSLFGVVFVIAYVTGKVIHYHIMSKHCAALTSVLGKPGQEVR